MPGVSCREALLSLSPVTFSIRSPSTRQTVSIATFVFSCVVVGELMSVLAVSSYDYPGSKCAMQEFIPGIFFWCPITKVS